MAATNVCETAKFVEAVMFKSILKETESKP